MVASKAIPVLARQMNVPVEELQQALAVRRRIGHVHHRRPQVGHGDGAAEHARGVGQHALHRGAVAEVDVPVVGADEGEGVGHASS